MTKSNTMIRLAFVALALAAALAGLALLQRGLAEAAAAAGVTVQPVGVSAQTVSAGSVTTYSLVVRNTGPAADVYSVTVSGYAWPTQILVLGSGTALLPLAAGTTQTVQVEVTVPVIFAGRDVARFTVTSQSTPTVTASLNLTTTVIGQLYLPFVVK